MIDEFSYEPGKRAASGGGGGEAVLIDKTISANGTYNASSDNADGYKKAVVNVPNSYAAGDEGKVVSNGTLVAQGSDTATQNGTVDTTLISSLTVNVSGGGGSNWTLLASQEFTVNTSSTTATEVGAVTLPDNSLGAEDLVLVHVRDKAGKRNGYWYGSDCIFINNERANNPSSQVGVYTAGRIILAVDSSGKYSVTSSTAGVYANALTQASSDHAVKISSRYSSSYGTISGTYKVDVYKLTPASGMTIFDA